MRKGTPSDRASLVAQLVKNPLAMRETWVQSLGLEDPLEKGTHSSILQTWRIPGGDAREYPGGLLRLDPAFAYAEPPSS